MNAPLVTTKTNRIDYLDVCKGILIILVVVGHAIEIVDPKHKSYFIKLIYSFHMPAFFIISGFLFNAIKWKNRGFKDYLLNRVDRNLIPYFFFEYLYGITASLFFYNLTWKGKIMELLYVVKGAFGVEIHYVPSWFLITLFFAGLAMYWLENKSLKKIIIEIVVLTAISIIGVRVINETDIRFIKHIVLFISRISIATAFMLFGLLWQRIDFSEINKSVVSFLCLAITLTLPFFMEWESISSFSIRYVLPFILTGITGTCVVIAICKRINCGFLRFLGKESLIIMGTH